MFLAKGIQWDLSNPRLAFSVPRTFARSLLELEMQIFVKLLGLISVRNRLSLLSGGYSRKCYTNKKDFSDLFILPSLMRSLHHS